MERNLAAAPHFEVKEPNEFLINPIRQEEYRRYRQQYRAHFGVLPELDSNHAFLGPHHQDQLDGMIIVLDTSTGEIIKQEYVMVDPRSCLGGLISRQKAKLDTHKNTINHLFGRFAR